MLQEDFGHVLFASLSRTAAWQRSQSSWLDMVSPKPVKPLLLFTRMRDLFLLAADGSFPPRFSLVWLLVSFLPFLSFPYPWYSSGFCLHAPCHGKPRERRKSSRLYPQACPEKSGCCWWGSLFSACSRVSNLCNVFLSAYLCRFLMFLMQEEAPRLPFGAGGSHKAIKAQPCTLLTAFNPAFLSSAPGGAGFISLEWGGSRKIPTWLPRQQWKEKSTTSHATLKCFDNIVWIKP